MQTEKSAAPNYQAAVVRNTLSVRMFPRDLTPQPCDDRTIGVGELPVDTQTTFPLVKPGREA